MNHHFSLPCVSVRARHGVAPRAVLVLALCAASMFGAATPAAAARPAALPVKTLAEADSLVVTAPGPARLGAFTQWAKRAPLEEIVYVLRRSPDQLADLERPALEAALERTPDARVALRHRIAARLALARPVKPKKGAPVTWAAMGPGASSIPSAYRVGLLLPDDGDYGDEAAAVGVGFAVGVESSRGDGRPPVTCVRYSTRADAPPDVAAALDSAAAGSGVLCGGFAATSAITLAAGSRWRGLPVVLPGAVEPAAPRLSPRIFGVGPTGAQRGRALAQAVAPSSTDRVALLISSAADTAFSRGFAAACRARGATVVSRQVYSPGNATFTTEIRSLVNQRATMLFWDGDPTEAAALLRQLTRERVTLRVCGGDGFDPARHHRETRVFLEGVTFAAADWVLERGDLSSLAAGMRAAGAGDPDAAHVRGYLAGRLVGAAIASGALAPEEIAAALAAAPAVDGEPGLLDARRQGGELPVYSIAAGKAARVQ